MSNLSASRETQLQTHTGRLSIVETANAFHPSQTPRGTACLSGGNLEGGSKLDAEKAKAGAP